MSELDRRQALVAIGVGVGAQQVAVLLHGTR